MLELPQECPDDLVVLAFLEGSLETAGVARMDAHLDGCTSCRALVGVLSSGVRARDADALALGAMVGRYEVRGVLGRGAMGTVYLAFDPMLAREVALKLLQNEGASADARARLLDEARAMARLEHPHVVAVYDVGEAPIGAFVAMERIRGGNLREAMGREATEAQRFAWMVGAGRGLSAAHAAGLVHRDFKPENVMVDDEGRARVTDFGVSTWVEPSTAAPPSELDALALTVTGALVGTPAYMAPEQLRGEPASAAADQFAFAMTFAEVLTGMRPHDGDDLPALSRAAHAGAPHLVGVPPELASVLRRALSVEPESRFPSMDDALAAIEEAIVARPRSRRPGRSRWMAWAASLALVGLGVAAWTMNAGRAPELPVTPSEVSTIDPRVAEHEATLASIVQDAEARPVAEDLVARARAARAAADAVDEPSLSVRAALMLGAVYAARGGDAAAADAFREGLFAAEAEHDDALVAEAWLQLIRVDARAGRYEDAEAGLAHVEAAMSRAGMTPLSRARLALARGALHAERGALGEAGSELEGARSALTDAHDATLSARLETALGNLARLRGDLDAALAHHQRALALDLARVGEVHARMARHHHNVAGILRLRGQPEEARTSYARALRVALETMGAHPQTALTQNSLGLLAFEAGALDEAGVAWASAQRIFEAFSHEDLAVVRANLARLEIRRERFDEAEEHARAALRSLLEHQGAASPRVADARLLVAEALLGRGDRSGARMALDDVAPEALSEDVRGRLSRLRARLTRRARRPRSAPTSAAMPLAPGAAYQAGRAF